ncbi:MAG: MATE family efflux transporter [Eudoraea sp.]|nr:MATE family efflux transporter [Eudoraea sp.]
MKKFLELFLQAIRGEEKDFTKGSINRAIVLLAVPMVLEMAMEALFALVDVFFVSQIGTEAVATIGLTEVVLFIIESVALGVSMAATAMIARRIGEKDKEGASIAAVQTIVIGIVFSFTFGLITFFNADHILRIMGGSPELVAQGSPYTRIILGFNCTLFFIFLLNAIFRGAGDAAIAMRTLILSNSINIVLDPCLIFGIGPFPELGLTGAAIATTIGRGTGVAYQIYMMTRGDGILKIYKRHVKVVWPIIKSLMKVAMGGIGQFIIATVSWVFIVRIIAQFGDQSTAGYSIAIRIIIFSILPAWGMANAAATLVGQNLGAKQPDRAEKSVWMAAKLNVVFLAAIGIVLWLIGPWMVQFFSKDPVVIKESVTGLRIFCLGYIFFAYGMVVSQAFNGAGDTFTPTLINFVCFWLVQIPVAYLLAIVFNLESAGAYWGIALSEALLAVISITIFRRGKWKLREI